ncbi:hypothetical protein N7492_008202 [Penicillium capsulatum]|uniref:Uncharacterized protein n=1 Tax=Penicillium capsulatum TaxID=69766 RepID=A0A9W9LGH3_9EURO|nr:hypothetical protein N7492_008202 [Penicillium capsulatum]KAJ6105612.1 hypothetical protein N7512_009129 [Penicillium capsulatum]
MAVAADVFQTEPAGEHLMTPQQLALLSRNEFPFRLQLPKPEDNMMTTVRKLQTLAGVVDAGHSLSLTAGVASNMHERKIEAFAKERMVDTELAQYEEWKQNKFELPEINWVANVSPVGPDSQKTFTQRAAAIDLIWQQQGTTPENAAWLTTNIPAMLPLVKAVTKLLSARTHLLKHDPLAQLSEPELVELETLKLIRTVTEENMAREMERVRQLAEEYRGYRDIIQGRLKSLQK